MSRSDYRRGYAKGLQVATAEVLGMMKKLRPATTAAHMAMTHIVLALQDRADKEDAGPSSEWTRGLLTKISYEEYVIVCRIIGERMYHLDLRPDAKDPARWVASFDPSNVDGGCSSSLYHVVGIGLNGVTRSGSKDVEVSPETFRRSSIAIESYARPEFLFRDSGYHLVVPISIGAGSFFVIPGDRALISLRWVEGSPALPGGIEIGFSLCAIEMQPMVKEKRSAL